MLPNDRAQPAAREKPSWGSRVLRWVGKAPLYVKLIVLVAAVFASPFLLLYALGSAVIDVVQKRPGRMAAYAVATWSIPVDLFSQVPRLHVLPLIVLSFAVAWAAGTKLLARWYLPCRTAAWAMLWSLPVGIVLLRFWPRQPLIGVVAAVIIAFAVVGWRLAKGIQDARMYGRAPNAPNIPEGPDGRPDAASQGHTVGPASGGRPRAIRERATRETASRATASGLRPRRCLTPIMRPVTTRAAGTARPGRGRRSRSRTPWPSSTP